MSLELDQRQRAMLLEMGVRVWQPEPAQVSAPEPAARQVASRVAPPAPPYAPTAEAPRVAHESPVSAGHGQSLSVAAPKVAPAQTAPPLALTEGMSDVATLDWAALQDRVASCQACGLCQGRRQSVFGVGDTRARWLVVGEAPGENEDLQGEPFVGQAGQLLDNMLRALGLSRTAEGAQAVYIANVIKCRPPANRNPQPQEVQCCTPYLQRQIALLQPQIILALGRFAAQALLQASVPEVATLPLGRLRGQVHRHGTVPVVVSYHPAYLLRTPQDKAKAWADLCLARATVDAG